MYRAYEGIRDLFNSIPKEAPVHVDSPNESKVHTELKLLKFSVPTFDGNIMNWSNFWDQFLVSIHDKTELSDTAKLAYLRDALKDEPAEAVIRGLTRTGNTYDKAVDCLQKWYDRPCVVHQTHVDAILNIPVPKYGNCRDMRSFHNTATLHPRALKAMKLDVDDLFVTAVLTSRIEKNTV